MKKYDAFISYSHAADGKLAPSLQNALHRIAKPIFQIRALNIFRDETSLSATPQLWSKIEDALDRSKYLILLASPAASRSEWVIKEVDYWLVNNSVNSVLIGVTEGSFLWDESKNDFDWQQTNCLPENLKEQFHEQPLFVDFREVKSKMDLSSVNPDFRKKAAVLAASIHKKPLNDLIGEDVRIRKKTVRITTIIITLLIGLSIGLFWFANSSKKNEEKANEEAERALEQECIAMERGDSLIYQLKIADSLIHDLGVAKDLAEEKTNYALEQENSANKERDRAILQTKKSDEGKLIYQAKLELEQKRTFEALKLAYQAYQIFPGTPSSSTQVLLSEIYHQYHNHPVPVPISKEIIHEDIIRSTTFSPDGKLVVTASDDQKIKLWNLKGDLIWSIEGHTKGVINATFSPDGLTILSCSNDNTAKLWSLDGNLIATYNEHSAPVNDALFSINGKYIITCSNDKSAKIWNLQGKLVADLNDHSSEVQKVRISSDNKYVLTITMGRDNNYNALTPHIAGGTKRQVSLWNIKGELLTRVEGDNVFEGRFLNNGYNFVTYHNYYNDVQTRAMFGFSTFDIGGPKDLSPRHFSEDGAITIFGAWDLKVWNIQGVLLDSISKYPNGERSFVGEKSVKVLNLKDKNICFGENHEDEIIDVHFDPNFKQFISFAKDNSLKLWDEECNMITEFSGHSSTVEKVLFSPNGEYILSSDEVSVNLWNRKGGLLEKIIRENDKIWDIGFANKNRFFFVQYENSVVIYDLLYFSNISLKIPSFDEEYADKDLLLEARKLITLSITNEAAMLSLKGTFYTKMVLEEDVGKEGYTFPIRSAQVVITVNSIKGQIKVLDIEGNLISTINIYNDIDYPTIYISPTGKYVYGRHKKGFYKIWDVYSGALISRFGRLNDNETYFSFSPDEKFIICYYPEEMFAEIWDIAGNPIFDIINCKGKPEFSIDGHHVLACSNNRVKLYDLKGRFKIISRSKSKLIRYVNFLPKTNLIEINYEDKGLEVKDIDSNTLLSFYKKNDYYIVYASEKSENIIVQSANQTELFDRNCKIKKSFIGGRNRFKIDVFSIRDNPYFITYPRDNTAQLWNWDGDSIAVFRKHKDDICRFLFSPNYKFLLTLSEDFTAILWDLKGNALSSFNLEGAMCSDNEFIFSNDERRIYYSFIDENGVYNLREFLTPEEIITELNSDLIKIID